MSGKHTPGPWAAGWGEGIWGERAAPSTYWDETNVTYVPIRKKGQQEADDVVCFVASCGETEDELMPDAHFIAAAPAMLEALKRARPYVADAVEKLKHTNEPVPARDLEKVDRALRLAEPGEER